MNTVTIILASVFVAIGVGLWVGIYSFKAGRIFERRIVSRNLADIIRLGVDRVLGSNETWSEPMRDQLQKKMFEQIEISSKSTRH